MPTSAGTPALIVLSSLALDCAGRRALRITFISGSGSMRPERSSALSRRARCEGKHDCVDVCPYGVFEVRRMDDPDFARLSLLGRLKSMAHRRQTAYTPAADACQACGLCVVSCPEKAISLVRV
ncbi:MAG TPA: 4Fe-4S binding protein [Polyangia bacterium]